MTNYRLARMLGWASFAIGAVEIFATRRLEKEMGVKGHETLLRAFGLREWAAGATILAQPTVNGALAAGLWSRVAGDAVDLAMLGAAAAKTRRPEGLAVVTGLVAGATAMDIVAAIRVQHELTQNASVAKAARERVAQERSQNAPAQSGTPVSA